ncbi:MAG: hypothetical protein JWL74_1799 [Alphaproteobacteria bacterium]|jgi:peptidoglycan/xylan/chitin deacetylase (PgdA/CDA1 family)|nr:hypothetical protein [Alphaproteobacteria bacterium]
MKAAIPEAIDATARPQGDAVSACAPELLVVVDTEEEFDWSQPFSRSNTATRSIPAQAAVQPIYDRLGVVPTYVIDYPVATDPAAVAFLRRLKEEGRAEIGAHLHPWVTPPHEEKVSARNSYECNLPPSLERSKIAALTDAIESAFGDRPSVFKAGRHGFGASTARAIAALGYKVDCSLLPYHDMSRSGGPDFARACAQPHWLYAAPNVLEVPVTNGFFGRLAKVGPTIAHLFDNPAAARLRIPGLLGKAGLLTRSRLTPEGVPAAEQCRLLDALVKNGQRVFTLVYHSPSLVPGNTPYVRSESELAAFLATIEQVLTYFRDVIGGRFATLTEVHARMSAERAESAPGARPGRRAQFDPPVAAAGRAARG